MCTHVEHQEHGLIGDPIFDLEEFEDLIRSLVRESYSSVIFR